MTELEITKLKKTIKTLNLLQQRLFDWGFYDEEQLEYLKDENLTMLNSIHIRKK